MIFDEFILLFRSDSKQVTAEVDTLNKEIEKLKSLGKNRSEEQSKQLVDYQKQVKELNEILKTNQERYDNIAASAEKAAQAALLGFGGLAKAVFGSASENSNLEVTAKRLGETAENLEVIGIMAERAGDSFDGFKNDYDAFVQKNNSQGIKTAPLFELIDRARERVKVYGANPTPDQLGRIYQQFGFGAERYSTLSKSKEEFASEKARASSLSKNFNEDAKAAREFDKAWVGVKEDLSVIARIITTDVAPALKTLESVLRPLAKFAQEHPVATGYASVPIAIGASALSLKVIEGLFGGLVVRTATADVAATAAGGGVSLLVPIVVAAVASYIGKQAYDYSSTHGFNANKNISNSKIGEKVSKSQMSLQDAINNFGDKDSTEALIRNSHAILSSARNTTIGTSTGIGTQTSSKSINVNVGNVTVNTNSTDVTGISRDISSQLVKHINTAITNIDDGVAY